mmetsp:Transcript_56889/g.112013  ORF Transcript_56889/g.112013 Transcript_56889/m.112013 type:complete len:313 (+) Transcript_56889:580-1518(+)
MGSFANFSVFFVAPGNSGTRNEPIIRIKPGMFIAIVMPAKPGYNWVESSLDLDRAFRNLSSGMPFTPPKSLMLWKRTSLPCCLESSSAMWDATSRKNRKYSTHSSTLTSSIIALSSMSEARMHEQRSPLRKGTMTNCAGVTYLPIFSMCGAEAKKCALSQTLPAGAASIALAAASMMCLPAPRRHSDTAAMFRAAASWLPRCSITKRSSSRSSRPSRLSTPTCRSAFKGRWYRLSRSAMDAASPAPRRAAASKADVPAGCANATALTRCPPLPGMLPTALVAMPHMLPKTDGAPNPMKAAADPTLAMRSATY